MKKENTMKYGEVGESITLMVEYETLERQESLRAEGKIAKTVSLEWGRFLYGNGMSIKKITDFQKHANALLQEIKDLLMSGTFVKVGLTKSAYEHVPEYTIADELGPHTCTLKQLEFESWVFEGNALDFDPEEEGAGLYLRPDTRYTTESWDMILFWKRDILESFAGAHL